MKTIKTLVLVSVFLTVAVRSLAIPNVTTSGSLCVGQTIRITVAAVSGCTGIKVLNQYDWDIQPAPSSITYIGSSSHWNAVDVVYNYATNVNVSVGYSCNSGPGNEETGYFGVGAAITPTVSPSASVATGCVGYTTTLYANPTNQGTNPAYSFYVGSNLVYSGSSSSVGYSTSGLPAGTYTVYVSMVNQNAGCFSPSAATNGTTSITVYASPYQGSLSVNNGNVNTCVNIPIYVNLSSNVGSAYYNVSYQQNSDPPVNVENTSSLGNSFNYNPYTWGNWTFETWSQTGCGNSSHISFSVYVWALPDLPVIQPVSPICQGQSVTLQAAGYQNGSAQPWMKVRWYDTSTSTTPLNADPYNGDLATGTLYQTRQYWAASYHIVASGVGCDGPRAAVTVTVHNPQTPPVPLSTNAVCGNQGLSYSGTPLSGEGWYWQGTNGNGQDYTSPSAISPTLTASATGTYYLRGHDQYGCWGQYSAAKAVTITYISPAAPPPPIQTINTCNSKTMTKPTAPAGITYFWELNSGGQDMSSAFATSPTLIASNSSTYYLNAKDNNGNCWSSTSFTVTVDPVDITVNTYDPSNPVVQATHSITLGPNFYVPAGSTFNAVIAITPECNNFVNWKEQILYDQNGNRVSDSRSYLDGFGAGMQSQTKDFLNNKMWGTQTLFNSFGKSAGSTLPAPLLENDFIYKNSLAFNASGLPYAASDFDARTNSGAPGEVNNPQPFGTQPGTVGWYYSSNNNQEGLTPTTQFPYSRSFTAEGPDPTSSVSAGPGDAFRMGSGHNPKSDRYLILSGELTHYYALRSYFSTSVTTTGVGYKYISTDPNGKQSVSFVDGDGRSVATAIVTSVSGTAPNLTFTYDYWSYTYYNDAGQVTATVAPKDVNVASTARPLATIFGYDHLGRLIKTKSQDEGLSYFVYSTDGKIRFSENAVQRNASPKRFSYTNYDYLGRLVESGEYTCNPGGYLFEADTVYTPSSVSVLLLVDRNFTVPIEQVNGSNYSGLSWMTDPTRCSDYSLITYDAPGSSAPQTQTFLYGQVSKTQNANATTWYSYDEDGQLIWTRQNIVGLGVKSVDYTYDYFGNVTMVAYQTGQADKFYHHYEYDISQRLTNVYTSFDGTTKTLQAKYKYYLHGALKRVELAGNLQGLDYVYAIDGSLKSINHSDIAKDPGGDGSNGFSPDVYGQTFNYYDNDYTGANYSAGSVTAAGITNQYNGMIKAQSWFTPVDNPSTKKIYGYTYDNVNQLTNAQFGSLSGTAGSYTATFSGVEAYREGGLSYDKNGNIQALTRKGKTGNTLASYGYTYTGGTNKLASITNSSSPMMSYLYNTIGQMTQQVESGVTTMNVSYTAYGLVKDVKDAGNNLIMSYTYDDRGNRISKTEYATGVQSKKTYYVSDADGNTLATYEQKLTSDPIVLVEVPVYGAGRIAMYKPAGTKWFYEINDNLGNVRAVIGPPSTDIFTATMETETATAEDLQFKNIAPRWTYVNANQTPGGNEAIRINNGQTNGGYAGRIAGPGIKLIVSPGDVISAEVYGYYDGGTGYNNTLPMASIGSAVAAVFGGFTGMAGDPGKIFNALSNTYTAGGFAGAAGSGSSTVPAAYLNLVMFDQNLLADPVTLPMAATPLTSAANGARQKITIGPITIPAAGYVYIYVNENSDSPNWIYFDDLKVTQLHSPYVAGADFYPFGLAMSDREITTEPYRFGYQGQFSEKDKTMGWNEFDLRMYDARFGRWLSPDPQGQFASPYVAMGNNPVNGTDPTGGLCPECIFGKSLGVIPENLAGPTSNLLDEVIVNGIKNGGVFSKLVGPAVSISGSMMRGAILNGGHAVEGLGNGYKAPEHQMGTNYAQKWVKETEELRQYKRISTTYRASEVSLAGKGITNPWIATGSGVIGAADIGTSITLYQIAGKSYWRAALFGANALSHSLAVGGILFSGWQVYDDLSTGNFNAHTVAGALVTVGSTVVVGAATVAGATPVAIGATVGGFVYGIAAAAGGDEWIDEQWQRHGVPLQQKLKNRIHGLR